MLPKYVIEYGLEFKKEVHPFRYQSDDPVGCKEFLAEVLEKNFRILAIKHDGADLSAHDFDQMVKASAGILAAKHICASLGLKAEEERFRFGFGL